MKAMLFTLIGVTAIISISIMSGLQCKQEAVYDDQQHSIVWTSLRTRPDGSMVEYTWIDSTGNYPYTRDTCCLDSVEICKQVINDTLFYVPCNEIK